jgi:hypothetical protein
MIYERVLWWLATYDHQQKTYGAMQGWRERPEYPAELDRVLKIYSEIVDEGQKSEGAQRPTVRTSDAIEEIRKILGIEELTRLRSELIRRASLD